jgi:hypothetical protein
MRIDLHDKEHLGNAFTQFKNPVHTVEELIGEIRRGNCRERIL